jgi:hypothetical protein
MIGFLKKWLVTKSELDLRDKQIENIEYGIQRMQMAMLVQSDANREQWRPEQKAEKAKWESTEIPEDWPPHKVVASDPTKQGATKQVVRDTHISTSPASLPRHIAEARIMVGKAGGVAKVKQRIASRQMRLVLSGAYNHTEMVYLGRLTIYDMGTQTNTKEKRYAMSFKTEKQVKEVMSYLRSAGITVKDNRK